MKRKHEKKEFIESLRKIGIKYITRAQHGELMGHREKPVKCVNFWNSKGRKQIESNLFNDLTWHDEPMYIGKERIHATNNELAKRSKNKDC